MTKQQVITFHYLLTNKSGKTIDFSLEGEPLTFLQGAGQIIPGLETALIDLKIGDKKNIVVPYLEAYGPYEQNLIYQVARNKLPSEQVKVEGMFQIGKENSLRVVTVLEVSEAQVTLDANHPLAGQDLNFEVEIMDSRDATVEELSHGHVHGAGGHHH